MQGYVELAVSRLSEMDERLASSIAIDLCDD